MRPLALVTLIFGTAACTNNVVLAPIEVQQATAGQDNREIVLPLAILGGLVFWGIQ